jgi:hypothetical protein
MQNKREAGCSLPAFGKILFFYENWNLLLPCLTSLRLGKAILAFAPEFDQENADNIDDEPVDKHQGGPV